MAHGRHKVVHHRSGHPGSGQVPSGRQQTGQARLRNRQRPPFISIRQDVGQLERTAREYPLFQTGIPDGAEQRAKCLWIKFFQVPGCLIPLLLGGFFIKENSRQSLHGICRFSSPALRRRTFRGGVSSDVVLKRER